MRSSSQFWWKNSAILSMYRLEMYERKNIGDIFESESDFEAEVRDDWWLPCLIIPKSYTLKRADEALLPEVCPDRYDISRGRAGVYEVLSDLARDGHTCKPYVDVRKQALTKLDWELEEHGPLVKEVFASMKNDLCCLYKTPDGYKVAKKRIADKEELLARIARDHSGTEAEQCDTDLSDYKLTDKQNEAVRLCLSNKMALVSGIAGTGKSRSLAALADVCLQNGESVLLCAPTGKAAKRIQELLPGVPASTIHLALGYNGDQWRVNSRYPLDYDRIIVDEVSMLDTDLAWRLLSAVDWNRSSVSLFGDHNQLPPVAAGNVLRDLIQADGFKKVVLEEVHRQAGDLKRNSTHLLAGEIMPTVETGYDEVPVWIVEDELETAGSIERRLEELILEDIPAWGYPDIIRDVQIITPRRKGVELSSEKINEQMQRIVQREFHGREVDRKFMPGDKVIQTRNNYKIHDDGLMNGTIGVVLESEPEMGTLVIDFEGLGPLHLTKYNSREIELAYALTVHKTQGSEYRCVIFIAHSKHAFMHHRNLFYTAATRSSETAIILGQAETISNCVAKTVIDERQTLMPHLIKGDATRSMSVQQTQNTT